MQRRSMFLAICTLLVAAQVRAEVRLPHMLGDHAVLQRDRPLRLWGWATPASRLELSLHGHRAQAVADNLGRWQTTLPAEQAGGPYTLEIDGDGPRVTVSDIMVGDVWFASGQSNMEMPLDGFPPGATVRNAAQEIANSTNPRLRLLLEPHRSSAFPLRDNVGRWTTCTPQTASRFSAVAYFFGRAIAADQHVTVGLIDATWGGTPADSWVSMTTLGSDSNLLPAFAARAVFAETIDDAALAVAAEQREDAALQAAGKSPQPHPWHPAGESWAPAGLYNGMVAPFTRYGIRGFLWYQGETNSGPGRAPFYATLFPALIRDWRGQFAQGDLPFLFAQISSFRSPAEDWGTVRDAQRRTLAVAHTAMVVTLDVGDAGNVHPADKQTVGARLALAARGLAYDEPVAWQPPLFRETTREPLPDGTAALRVSLDHANGLAWKGIPGGGFEIAGPDRHFVPAVATLQAGSVLVSAAAVADPAYVRYGWDGVMSSYLVNAAGLPASTFTSELRP